MKRTLPSTSAVAGVSSMEPSYDVATLLRTRTSITGRISRLGEWIASVESLEQISIDDIETRLSYLTKSYEQYEHVQNQIELITTDTEQSECNRAQVESQFFHTVSTYKKFLRSLNTPVEAPTVSHPQSDDGTNVENMFSTTSRAPVGPVQNSVCLPDIRLPAITLPTFNGECDDFISFSELFKSIIDDSPQLSDTTRFYYLKSALKGTAANVIRSIPATGNNYSVAWNLLRERYLCTGATIQKLNSELLNLPIVPNDSPIALRKLLDSVLRITRSLKALNTIQKNGDSIFCTIVLSKLDIDSKRSFQMFLPNSNHIASLDELQTFLSKRVQVLESLQTSKKESGRHVTTLQAATHPSQPANRHFSEQKRHDRTAHNNFPSQHRKPVFSSPFSSCLLCNSPQHRLAQCQQYKSMSVDDRIKCINTHLVCFNCLSPGHVLATCPSPLACLHCARRHHSSIHRHPVRNDTSEEPAPNTAPQPSPAVSLFNKESTATQIMLGTANLYIYDVDGTPHLTRALVDSGSQPNIVTKALAEKLHLPIISSHLKITGIGNSKTNASQRIFAKLSSCNTSFNTNAEFLILPVITSFLPSSKIDSSQWNLPSDIDLADEDYDIPAPIDILIGADLFFTLLDGEKISRTSEHPALIKTKLGWIFGGKIPGARPAISVLCNLSLSDQIERFWKLDECPPASMFTAEELECENHFSKTHSRATDGRYIVRLPFKRDPTALGHSRSQARRRWLSVEARLERDGKLREDYHNFIKTYLALDHMSCLGPETEVPDRPGDYHLPHHPVLKEQSTSTKVRVVFDGSMTTTSGTSLNNLLMVGPIVQSELFEILLRFRKHTYVIMGDIEKMFRQILVEKIDRSHQRIFWRESPTRPLCIYELNTVTYGLASAPHLATRSLKQLALDERENFPSAHTAVLEDFYVDDLLTGHDTLQGALALQKEIKELLSRGQFPLKKWAANHPALLEDIPAEDREKLFSLTVTSGDAVKTLGLTWLPEEDIFIYDASKISCKPATTKRKILSQISSLYDPLGILGPIVCSAKFFMQELWIGKYDWDTPLPTSLIERWNKFNQSLKELHEIRIPRFVSCSLAMQYELHGFSDASQSGYGCAIYMRTKNSDNEYSVHLLCAKSRVAPAKQLTIPRLELAAALLLVRLFITVKRAMKLPQIPTVCWSDSKIVLSWLALPPHNWKVFVANRVAEIQDYETTWKYVPSENNPADLISRGTTVSQLKTSSLWWEGPDFLRDDKSPLLSESISIEQKDAPERRKTKQIIVSAANIACDIFSRFSSLHTLVSTTAWILRFIHNARNHTSRIKGLLTARERTNALSCLIRAAQAENFSSEINSITKRGHVSKKSKLRQLIPFIDENKLHVGGRLKNSPFSKNFRHPIILAPNHPLTVLIITDAHIRCLHGGTQLVLNFLRQKYWIVNAKSVIRRILYQCVSCFKARPTNNNPLMGQLPAIRSTPSRPFLNTGVDFAGPFLLKPPTRSNSKLKHYVAVFVCMSTKATHLELVGSLTSESFIATLKRFVSRRGLCQSISCDNAKNFVGTRNTLKEIYQFIKRDNEAISNYLSKSQIQWHFIPPLAPHCGGLWEAGVKSMKYHLRRVAGLAFLTYEEFSTVLCAIEACLNSRPLTPLSSDPTDYEALTPGHFLIGTPLLAVPEADQVEQSMSRLTRWHRTQAITQHFWKRWSSEYIATLTPLSKWTEETTPLSVEKLVLIKDDHLPPLQWKLGRIVATHPGKDDITRVVTIQTATGTIKRNACKVFPLPIEAS